MNNGDSPSHDDSIAKKRTEILYGAENAVGRGISFMKNVKIKMDITFDYNAPSIVIDIPQYTNGYKDILRKGAKIRCITEITKDNIQYCKKLMDLVSELRHMDSMKGGIAINESEYMATTVLQESQPLTEVIYSNVKEVVDQGQYIFDTFWRNAVSAKKKIRDIEEGFDSVKTEVLENQNEIKKAVIDLALKSNDICICTTIGGIKLIYDNFLDTYKEVFKKHRNGEHKGVRWITSINHLTDIELVRLFLKEGVKIRHVKSIPFHSFALSDKMLNSTVEMMKEGGMISSLLNSNDRLYLGHYNTMFKELWITGIDAKERIKDIEESNFINIDIIPNPSESLKFVFQIAQSASKEILVLLSSTKGFLRTENSGGLNSLNQMASNGIKVRVLIPSDSANWDGVNPIKSNYHHIEFKSLQVSMQFKIGIIIVDKEKSIIFEIRDDTKDNFMESLGLALHIEGKSTALSYATVFDSLWKQAEMYQQLQTHDLMRKEFINIAAHELRTPIQPILGLTELVMKRTKDNEQKELLGIVISNANRLKKLSEDILDVTKIESNSLDLNKEKFHFKDIVVDIVSIYRKCLNQKNIEFKYFISDEDFLYADKNRITQVISNLVSNSIKYTGKEAHNVISITVETKETKSNSNGNKTIIISVKDNGVGIDKNTFPKLFSKFQTTSFQGIGLGLYICKSIIEAHGGTMSAKNNEDGKGATFSFSLPIMVNNC
ncbi:MAG: HAMP domain-containing histidine kinase [Nitrosopumilus sp.]|nr:HAMP domain-containing histidine kinase [Nitrosopumilus sp.]